MTDTSELVDLVSLFLDSDPLTLLLFFLVYLSVSIFSWLGLPSPYDSPVDAFESRRGSVDEEQAETRRAERRREHPHLAEWLDRGRSYAHPYHFHPSTAPRAEEEVPKGNMRVQVVRSSGDWSHGILTGEFNSPPF